MSVHSQRRPSSRRPSRSPPVSPLACAAPDASAPPAPGPAPKGIEVGDVDRAADPCTDFYAFANGAWRAANPIPAGTQRWSRRLAAREANREQLKALLEELAAKADRPRGSVEQLLGDHFASCMDEPAIDAMGVAPLVPLLADIAGVHDVAGVQRMIRRLHELAIPAPFVVTGASDYHDPASVIVNIAAGGLGLPDREYYLGSEPRFVEARERYRAHVASVLALGGMPGVPARKAAEDILALETRLAEASLAPAAAADPAATAHKVTFAQLAAARFDWDRYFAEAGLPRADLNVAEPALLERLDRELAVDARRGVEGVPDLAPARVGVALAGPAVRRGILRLQGQVPRRRQRDEASRRAMPRVDRSAARRASRP